LLRLEEQAVNINTEIANGITLVQASFMFGSALILIVKLAMKPAAEFARPLIQRNVAAIVFELAFIPINSP
jgi:hypothetical protein